LFIKLFIKLEEEKKGAVFRVAKQIVMKNIDNY